MEIDLSYEQLKFPFMEEMDKEGMEKVAEIVGPMVAEIFASPDKITLTQIANELVE